jgi:hypothetical protein
MKRALPLGLALCAACACASPKTAQTNAIARGGEKETQCHLLGSLAGQTRYNPRVGILDERTTLGPSRVIWLNRPNTSHIVTPEGDLYECDRIL